MRTALFISLRYLLAKRREKFISVISLISVAGIAIGVAALIVVIAVMSGFDNELKEKIIGTNAHITVEKIGGLAEEAEIETNKIAHIPYVAGVTKNFPGQAIIKSEEGIIGVVVKGIDPETEGLVTKFPEYVGQETIALNEGEVILGSELAKRLNLVVGDEVEVYTISDRKASKLIVAGFYTSGMYDIDSMMIFITLTQAQILYKAETMIGSLGIKLSDPSFAEKVKWDLRDLLGYNYIIMTWMETNRELFSALKLEKFVMFIILSLIVIVACFNIASTLIMVVMEKTKDIGILKAIGASKKMIMWIFTFEGMLLGLIGTLLGAGGGIGICYLLDKYQFIQLPQDVYYIDKLPINIDLVDCGVIVIASLVLSLFSTIYPAFQASRLKPVEALRYE